MRGKLAGCVLCLTLSLSHPLTLLTAQAPEPVKSVSFPTIKPADLKEWLTYIASDELEGRQVFTEGYGIAAEYVAEHLRQWGVKPLGDHGTYFQIVRVRTNAAGDGSATRLTRNVVGLVEGTDPILKSTYVFFGAHLDHVGYSVNDRDEHLDGSTVGVVRNPIAGDKIWNGADDDGTGTTAELAVAKAFATGPKPRRSVVFIWHAGEEADLYGSKYNAEFPVVPLDKVQCELNIDMIGRNRDDDPAQANTLFVIGADRISTDLHNLIVDTNTTLAAPLRLDYQYNDPTDPENFYVRSDHYSYAQKGIPIAFFFTGTHPDYHANSDSVEKILFEKQARIAQLVYQTGFAIANAPGVLERDNKGPRAGKNWSGKIGK